MPAANCHFIAWREADTIYSRSADTVATITGNRSFTAIFAIDTYSLDLAASDPSLGNVSSTFNAPEETLLTVITQNPNLYYPSPQYSEPGRATLSFSESVGFTNGAWKTYCTLNYTSYGYLEVTANEGYTVTRITFNVVIPSHGNPIEIAQPPFKVNFVCDDCYINNGSQGVGYNGVTSINVYGYRNPVDHGTVNHGTVANLSATPAANCHFDGWREADTIYSRSADTVATISSNRSFTALFALDTHTVSVAANDTTMGGAAVTGVVDTLSERLLTVITPGGYTVAGRAILTANQDIYVADGGWEAYGGPLRCGVLEVNAAEGYTVTRITFTLTEPYDGVVCEIVDNAPILSKAAIPYVWAGLSGQYGTGKVTSISVYGYRNPAIDPSGSICTADHGTTINLTATPKPGYHFVEWHENDTIYSSTADTTATINGDRFLVAFFAPDTHDVFVICNDTSMGDAGVLVVTPGAPAATIEPFAEVGHGVTISITAVPKPGYRFVEWHEDDTLYSSAADTVVTVLADRFLVAIFALDTHEWVDMGFGLLWATCNVGADNPWDYGDYFAWGETQPKSSYSWETYIWGDSITFTRYTHTNDMLLPEDDAATANWGGDWRMPTRSEWYTLVTSSLYTRTYVPNYQGSGRSGIVVTCRYGRCEGNSIFLPFAGQKLYSSRQEINKGHYLSGILQTERFAYGVKLDASTSTVMFIEGINRRIGASVRAVRQYPTYTVTSVSGNDTMGSVTGDGFFVHGETDSLTATPNAGYHFVCWMEADTVYSRTADTVVTVTGDRSFTAVFAPDMADLVLTNVSYTRFSQNKLRVEYQFVNQGEVDYTETIGFTVYRNHYRGEVLGGGPRMIIDEDMLASSGNVATRSYIFYKAPICSLDPEDSLVIAINDMGFGVGHHAGAQPERDTLNNIAVLHINDVYPYRHAYSVDVQAACDSLTWIDDSTYRASTDTAFITVVQNYNSTPCDSIVRLDLTINHSTAGDTTAVVCDSLAWYGETYTASAEPTQLFEAANAAGCDSTVTLHLTVNHSNTGDTNAVVCDSMAWYGVTYTSTPSSTSLPSHTSTNVAGCDSVVTLHLTVNHSNTGDTNAVVCDSMAWYGVTYTSTPSSTSLPSHTSTNVAGCDSVVTLHLTVNYSNTGDTTAVVCDSLAWYGTTYTSSTSLPSHTSTNVAGCDSVVTLHLTVNYSNTGDTTAVVCDSMAWYGVTYTSSTSLPSHTSTNVAGCDSVVTLHLTVNYHNAGDTTAVECDQFSWWEHTGLTASVDTLTHFFAGGNQWGCDSTVTLHLTVNYQNTGDTTAVECDQFDWWEHTGLTASVDTLTHFFAGGNQWNCDSTVTLHLTVNYQNTGDTTAVECDQFSWYEHSGITASVDTLTHLFAGANQWGCDSTVTLDLTINYQNTGDTSAVECDSFSWYEHTDITSSINTLTHLFAGANQWGCDSTVTLALTVNYSNTGDTNAVECDHFTWYGTDYTATATPTHVFTNIDNCDSMVTLHLTVNYQNTGDTTAVECDQFTWYGTNYTATDDPTHLFAGGNQWGCDSTLTLHLTVHYQNTGDTTAVECDQFSWWEHTGLTVSSNNLTHLFTGGNQWGCDSTVTLHLRYALFATDWSGPTTVIYNSAPQTALGATYVDDTGRTQQVTLTFTNGSEVITTPNYPVTAGVWNVLARPILPVDSLYGSTSTLTILPAAVYVSGAEAQIAKVVDGNATAVVTDIGTLNNIQGSDELTHTTTAAFNDATVGEGKTITLTYALHGTADLLSNYTLDPVTEVYTTSAAIVEPILPAEQNAFDVEVYGYCVGEGFIGYHLSSGNPDQYKLDFEDSRFTDVDWTDATGANGTLLITVPAGLPTGDYTVTVTFREERFPWIESNPLTVTFHVDLPSGYVKPLFNNVIALVDTCQCFTDIQWYHRSGSSEVWQAIPGATGYYYREATVLSGEYFVNAKMYGVPTYTCPQSDFVHLVSDGSKEAKVTVWPNPASGEVTVLVEGLEEETHTLRVLNTVGVELESRTFEGATTTVDFSLWQRGSYVVSVDGMVVRVVRN